MSTAQPDGPSASVRISVAIVLAVVSAVLALSGRKLIPGGPLISVLHDVAPCAMAAFAIRAAWACLRSPKALAKVAAVICILIATIAAVAVLGHVYSFWVTPHARGHPIGL